MRDSINDELRSWLDTKPDERDYERGNTLLLLYTRNKIRFNNLARLLPRESAKAVLDYELQKFYRPSSLEVTHTLVEQMQDQVNKIAAFAAADSNESPDEKAIAAKVGKRTDHDSLPEEIQALYVENLDLLRRIRQNKLELNQIVLRNSTCPDNDRYPFLKEIIRLDKLMRDNWRRYDEFNELVTADARAVVNKSYGTLNLLKARYKKSPNAELKARILALYNSIPNPTDKLTVSLRELEIL